MRVLNCLLGTATPVGNASSSRVSLPRGASIAPSAGTTPVDTMAGKIDWRKHWGSLPTRWVCGCSVKTFGTWREYHALSCPDRRVGIGRDVLIPVVREREWSRLRDPRRNQRKHYLLNRRKFLRISEDASAREFGRWDLWTDRT